MKTVLRTITVNSFALWATSQLVNGLIIKGGLDVILFGGIALTLMNFLIKPILSLIALPFNLLTMGLFSWVLNVFLVYLLTVFVSSIVLTSYTFGGTKLGSIAIGQMHFSSFQTAILVAFLLSFIVQFILWLFHR